MIRFNLHLAMARAGIKQQQVLAERAGLTKSQVSVLFRERTAGITWKTLDRLCYALNCTPGDLLEYVPSQGQKPATTEA